MTRSEVLEAMARGIADHIAQHPWETMAEDRSDLRNKIWGNYLNIENPAYDGPGPLYTRPSHWMPLPDPPGGPPMSVASKKRQKRESRT